MLTTECLFEVARKVIPNAASVSVRESFRIQLCGRVPRVPHPVALYRPGRSEPRLTPPKKY